VIRSNVRGNQVDEFEIEITKLLRNSSDGREMVICVKDPDLIAETGGIVQGMSGSPVIQNGRIVGAVTHVLVNDPTRGYGIFIENMLEAAK
jgi:stage IV sporulation protein B